MWHSLLGVRGFFSRSLDLVHLGRALKAEACGAEGPALPVKQKGDRDHPLQLGSPFRIHHLPK